MPQSHSRYLGRDEHLTLTKLCTVSRRFDRGINLLFTGTASVGKSKLVEAVLDTMDPADREDFSRVSANYLLYRKEGLDHRVISFFENHGTSEAAHIIRTAISEGKLILGTVTHDQSGALVAQKVQKTSEGMVIISTQASGGIDHERQTRIIEVEISHEVALAREVLAHKAASARGADHTPAGIVPYRIWQIADSLIESLDVVVPYANELAQLFPVDEERHMRDFDKVIGLVKTSALWHQYQRPRDEQGRVIAAAQDYGLIYSLRDLISQSVSPAKPHLIRFLETAKELHDGTGKFPTRAEVREALHVSNESMKRYTRQALEADLIEVSGKGEKQTIKVLEIPEPISPLPDPKKMMFFLGDPVTRIVQTAEDQSLTSGHGDMTRNNPVTGSSCKTDQTGRSESNGNDPLCSESIQRDNANGSSGHGGERQILSERDNDEMDHGAIVEVIGFSS